MNEDQAEKEPLAGSTPDTETARGMGQVAASSQETPPDILPAVLYLETTREGGEAAAIRNKFKELRAKTQEDPAGEAALDLEEYCLYSVLRDLLPRGSVNTTLVGANVPKRYLPKRMSGESKSDFADRETAMRRLIQDAFTKAYHFVMRPGVTKEQVAAVNEDVEARREVLERELREQAAAKAAAEEESTEPPQSQA